MKKEKEQKQENREVYTHTHTQDSLKKIKYLIIGMSIVMLIQFVIITFIGMGLTVQKKEIAEAKEPLKMQESLVQTANLAQTKVMAVAAGDENKYSTIAEVKSLLNSQMLSTYPVGSIYMSTSSTNPSSLFGGTWVAWGSGRVPVGINAADGNFNSVEKTGGESSHKLSVAEMPSHTHSIPALSGSTNSAGSHNHIPSTGGTFYSTRGNGSSELNGISDGNGFAESGGAGGIRRDPYTNSSGAHTHTVTTNASTTGGSGGTTAHNNLQPYITCYMWKRTA